MWLFCGPHADGTRIAALEAAGVNVKRTTVISGHLWLPAVTEALASAGITRLLVEGGPSIWRAFGRAGLVDEVFLFRSRGKSPSPLPMGAENSIRDLADYIPTTALELVDVRRLPTDEIMHLRTRRFNTIDRGGRR